MMLLFVILLVLRPPHPLRPILVRPVLGAWVNLNDITLMVIALGLERLAPAAVKEKLYGDDKVLKKG